jgi:cell division protein FtsZ
MISHSRASRQIIDPASVKVIGIGGAGGNLLERIALDGMDAAGLLLLHADARVLASCVTPEKIHLGKSLLKGLGAGGDPELGEKAALEVEADLRRAMKGQQVIFVCVGLGGGTGSGAAPVAARIAREEGAFVIVLATMPFAFEGKRRREQADVAIRELSALSDALITFDNNRMGEFVLAKQGAHDAFAASDRIVCESIRSIIRMITRQGLIHLGLDELMAALGDGRSHCLFGCGTAEGKDRSSAVLRQALASPLLDQGTLLKKADTVLVHLCGGEDLTLLEIELIMQSLQKFVPVDCNLLFGAMVDPAMGSSLRLTLISSLCEGSVEFASRESLASVPAFEPSPPELREREVEPIFELNRTPVVTQPSPPVEADLFAARSAEPDLATEPDRFESFDAPAKEHHQEPEAPAPLKPGVATKPWKKSADSEAGEQQKVKLTVKASGAQSELSLDSVPRGRFEGENPNVFEGEDLDLPPFLRKKK